MANIVNFTDKQFENRLNDNLEELVQGKKAVESPTAFLLGGQPGSGKTSLRSAILEETQGNVVVIDKLSLKPFASFGRSSSLRFSRKSLKIL